MNNLFQVRILQVKEIFIVQKTSEADTGAEQVHTGAEDQAVQEVTGEQPQESLIKNIECK